MGGMCMRMDTAGPTVVQPAATEPFIEPAILTDTDPDPAVFEAELSVESAELSLVPGQIAAVYAYRDENGSAASIPGPTIDVVEGTIVRIHVTNRLDEPTSIHWHGLVLPIEMDGVPDMPAPALAPGETYTYEFEARHPSLYWYHPHFRTDVQAERGLYGAFIVRPADVDVEADRERVLVLDDILLDEAGQIAGPSSGSDHVEDADTGEVTMTFEGMMGRQGNRLLVNGRMNPIIEVQPGAIERWRLVNSSNSRFFDVAIGGLELRRIGGDGGLVANPTTQASVLLGSAQRADLLVRFDGEPGDEFDVVTLHVDRGHDMSDPGALPLARVRLVGEPLGADRPYPDVVSAEIESLVEGDVLHVVEMTEVVTRGGRMGFALNGELWPDVPMLRGRSSPNETWEIVNHTHMAHPFHLHGARFQVTSIGEGLEGPLVPVADRVWTDTVLLGAESRLRFVSQFEEFAGNWMYHCHILEHAERGMMGMIEVTAP